MEFLPANRAYRATPLSGFRTFLKFHGRTTGLYEPFGLNHHDASASSVTRRMRIRMHDLILEETHHAFGLEARVHYFTIPHEPLAALARVVSITNRSRATRTVELLDGLGSTEMFHVFVSARPGRARAGATGETVPGYRVRVVDEHLEDVPDGTVGQLAVSGPTGCKYWKKPDRQREYVRRGWNFPGDMYVRGRDGYFQYQCRGDDLIITSGYNVAGPEVEAVLLEHPSVAEVAVVASPDELRGHVVKAFVVLRSGLAGSPELVKDLQDHVRRELAPYKYPREVEFLTELPRTETGKLRRVELRRREIERKKQEA